MRLRWRRSSRAEDRFESGLRSAIRRGCWQARRPRLVPAPTKPSFGPRSQVQADRVFRSTNRSRSELSYLHDPAARAAPREPFAPAKAGAGTRGSIVLVIVVALISLARYGVPNNLRRRTGRCFPNGRPVECRYISRCAAWPAEIRVAAGCVGAADDHPAPLQRAGTIPCGCDPRSKRKWRGGRRQPGQMPTGSRNLFLSNSTCGMPRRDHISFQRPMNRIRRRTTILSKSNRPSLKSGHVRSYDRRTIADLSRLMTAFRNIVSGS